MARKKAVKKIRSIKSTTGSSIYIPPMDLETRKLGGGLEAPYDRYNYLAPEWEDNPYLLEYIRQGKIVVQETDSMPAGAVQMPEDLDSAQREWIRTLCYSDYTDQFKVQIRDWHDRGPAQKTSRREILIDRVKPMLEAAILIEKQIRNRADVIEDLSDLVNFIETEGWRKSV
jgi:hypothetical protein